MYKIIMSDKKVGKIIAGALLLAAGAVLMIYTFNRGWCFSKITLHRSENSVYVGGVFGKDKIARLSEVRSFKAKPVYQKSLFAPQGSLCYNLEMTKHSGEKTEVFPFCSPSPEDIKTLAKNAGDFLSKPNAVVFGGWLFSLANTIWFLVGAFAAVAGYLLVKRASLM